MQYTSLFLQCVHLAHLHAHSGRCLRVVGVAQFGLSSHLTRPPLCCPLCPLRCAGTHWETLSEDITSLGSHYLLIHYDVQYFTRLEQYRLRVHGCVERPLTLSLQQVKELAGQHVWTQPMVMECSGNGRAMMKPRYNKHVPWGQR